jgi:hypothetical protein
MAVTSMVLGIVSVVLSCLWFLAIPAAIVGLILGIINLKNKKGGKGMAIAGLILSGLGLLVGLYFAIFTIFLMDTVKDYSNPNSWNDILNDLDYDDWN